MTSFQLILQSFFFVQIDGNIHLRIDLIPNTTTETRLIPIRPSIAKNSALILGDDWYGSKTCIKNPSPTTARIPTAAMIIIGHFIAFQNNNSMLLFQLLLGT